MIKSGIGAKMILSFENDCKRSLTGGAILLILMLSCLTYSCKTKNSTSIVNFDQVTDTSKTMPLLELNNDFLVSSLDTFIYYLSNCKFTTKKKDFFVAISYINESEIIISTCQDFNFLFLYEATENITGSFEYKGYTFIVFDSIRNSNISDNMFIEKGQKTFRFSKTITQYGRRNSIRPDGLSIKYKSDNNYYVIEKIFNLCE